MINSGKIFRQPDIQLGFIYSNWLTMGMLISGIIAIVCIGLYFLIEKKEKKQ